MARRTLSVLIVEDAADSRELFSLVFETAGFRSICAESIGEALKVMCDANVDAIVTDYHLPDGNGLSLLDLAVKQGHLREDVPAVLCTACPNLRINEHKFVAIFTKPVDTSKLVRAVYEAIAMDHEAPEEMAS